jgi:hypothetical protein
MTKIFTAAAILLASTVGAIAAPFCLVIPNGTPECIYADGASCSADANRQNGSCQVNAAETRVPASRVGQYCLILPSGASICGWADGNECSREALIQKGACTLSAGATTVRIPDAYAPNAGR